MAHAAAELQILNAIAEQLNTAGDLRSALERTLALTAKSLGLRTGWVWLLDPESDRFYNAAAYNLPPYLQKPVRMAGNWCECTDAFRSGRLAAKNIDVIECSRLRPAVKRKLTSLTHGLSYHASIPLYFQKKPLGIMNVTGPSWRKLSSEELSLLSTIAYQIAIAIERARLADEAARLARGEERAHLARELHDTLVQSLTGVTLQLESALKHIGTDQAQARGQVGRALDVTRTSLDELRHSVLDLRTGAPRNMPLLPALDALARGFTSETGVPVRIRAEADLELPARAEAEVFRIVQEALTNVRKHAQATAVEITLALRGKTASVTVSDNGKGFVPASNRLGHGLVGMQERARILSGALRVRSTPGKGTVIAVSLPRGIRPATGR
jgi:two-component system NarL family sensor kinase